MPQDPGKHEVLARIIRALRSLRSPFSFERDTILAPLIGDGDNMLDKFCGTDKEDAALKKAMLAARAYCDSIGFRLVQGGSVSLAVVVFAENLSRDEMVGRSVIVLNGLDVFKKFDMRNRWAFPMYANIFFTFTSSDKAFRFRNEAQEQCKLKKFGVLRTLIVKPWSIDFQGKSVAAPRALLSGLDKEPSELETKLFNTR